ncbi:hypothetical protein ACQKPX_25185, partial [Photobacterium sp. DNB23_23_1]
ESTGLENRHTFVAYLGFKSLSLRHIQKSQLNCWLFYICSLAKKELYQTGKLTGQVDPLS